MNPGDPSIYAFPALGSQIDTTMLPLGGFIFKVYFVLNVVYCVSVYMQCPRKAKVSDSPGVGVTGGCQLPCVGAGNRMWGLCESGV